MLGRGVAFMQQYITNGSPLRLKETDRKNLSQILEVNEQELTDLSLDLPFPGKLNILEGLFAKNNSTGTVQIDIISATACCGSGNEILAEDITGHWIIPQADFHTLPFSAAPNNIKMLRVSGDSMEPTLKTAIGFLPTFPANLLILTAFTFCNSQPAWLLNACKDLSPPTQSSSNQIILSIIPKTPILKTLLFLAASSIFLKPKR